MPIRHAGAAAFAAERPTSQAGHLGGQAGLIEENKPLWIGIGLPVEPIPASPQDVLDKGLVRVKARATRLALARGRAFAILVDTPYSYDHGLTRRTSHIDKIMRICPRHRRST